MKIQKIHWMGGIFALLVLTADVIFFMGTNLFFFLLGIGLTILMVPILLTLISQNKKEKELNEQFLEFSRNLAESVKSGTPMGKSIMNLRRKDFGPLSPYIVRLANQISMGIPISRAFDNFALGVNSSVIKRAITLIREAENAGGQIETILDSVANSIYEIEKLKKERKSAISTLVVQGYIIFLIFVGIMLVMEFKILPLTTGVSSISSFQNFDVASGDLSGLDATTNSAVSPETLARPFLYLLLTQGFFAGLVIGKLSEGSVKAGVKHSIVLVIISLLISSGARVALG